MSYTPPPPPPPPGGSYPPPPPPGGSFPPPGGFGGSPYGAGGGSPDPMGRALAEPWERLVSGLVDAIIIGVVGAIINQVAQSFIVSVISGFVLGTIYFGLMDSAMTKGQTVGKMVLGMATVDAATGQPQETGASFVRGAVKAALWYLTCCVGAIVDLVLVFTDKQRQSVHDKVGKTLVVKTK